MKKEWTFERFDQEHVCHLDKEAGTIQIQEPQYTHTLAMTDWLTTIIYRLPLEIEMEVTKSVVECLEPSILSEQQQRHYLFWRHLEDTKLLTSSNHLTIKPHSHWNDVYFELTPLGARFVEATHKGEKYIMDERRLDHLFFQGPSKALSFSSRVEIRNLLMAALSPEAGFTLSDSFPLFDYTKIPFRRYDHSEDNNYSGTYWILEGSHITIGSWSRQGKDGGANQRSIENAWPELKGLSGPFEQHREEIYTLLESAIIKE